MHAHEQTTIIMTLHLLQRFIENDYSILKCTHLENIFCHINNLHQNINFTIGEESNGALAFLDTLLKHNDGNISVLVYKKLTHADQYLPYSSHYQTSCMEDIVPSWFNRAYCIITNKEDLAKENAGKSKWEEKRGIKKILLINGLRKLPTIMACVSDNN